MPSNYIQKRNQSAKGPGGVGSLGLQPRIRNALIRSGITTVHQLRNYAVDRDPNSLLTIQGIGRNSARDILLALQRREAWDATLQKLNDHKGSGR